MTYKEVQKQAEDWFYFAVKHKEEMPQVDQLVEILKTMLLTLDNSVSRVRIARLLGKYKKELGDSNDVVLQAKIEALTEVLELK